MKVQDYLKNRSKNEIQNETLVEMVIGVEHEAEERIAQALKHYEAGKRDCKNGIYDKWYRYNTYQDGQAYDMGWTEANEEVQNENVRFLEP